MMDESQEQFLVMKLREAGDRIFDLEEMNSRFARYLDAAGLIGENGEYTGPEPALPGSEQ